MSDNQGTWAQVVDRVLGWLKTVLPLALFSAIVRYFKRKAWFAERKIEEKELELEEHRNREEVEEKYDDVDDIDVVRDAIREGRGDSSS